MGAWLIRQAFDRDGVRTDAALRELVPDDVTGEVDVPYGTDPEERYDVWRPAGTGLPLVFWVHGGGWIAGDKAHLTSYAKILAARGFEVVTPNYTLAPLARYPHALHQVGAALVAALADGSRPFVLAGDSAGAHLAAQLGTALTDRAYADALGVSLPSVRRPAGMLLHCGAYVPSMVSSSSGPGGWFVQTVASAYLGTRDFDAQVFDEVDLTRHVTSDFPPTWISGGNADPLTGQGLAFASRLEALGVPVTPVFYEREHEPRLNHEYQFDLTLADSRAALDSSVAFLHSVTG